MLLQVFYSLFYVKGILVFGNTVRLLRDRREKERLNE